ncbi:MAG: hypothetical protein ACI89L_001490 [Phycisphaerales bacterium]|jgi:hypothetical protein
MTTNPHCTTTTTAIHASTRPLAALTLAAAMLAMGSCGQSEPEFAAERGGSAVAPTEQAPSQQPADDRDQRTATTQPEPEPTPTPTPTPVATDDGPIPDHVRERPLVENTGTRSSLGRTRDSARGLRNSLQGGLETGPLAITNTEDEYIQLANVHWDMPAGWQLAIPQEADVLEEIVVPSSAYGHGRIIFTRTQGTPSRIVQFWEGQVLNNTGSPASAETTPYEAGDYDAITATMNGTLVSGGKDHPFYAVNMVLVDLGDGTVATGVYLAPEENFNENAELWQRFLNSVSIE